MALGSGAAQTRAPFRPCQGVRVSGSRAGSRPRGPPGARRRRRTTRRKRGGWRGEGRFVPSGPRTGAAAGAPQQQSLESRAPRASPSRAGPSEESVPPPLPGQDKGSLTRDGTALHKWDWSEREPETEREQRERQGPRELGEATGARAATDRRPPAGQAGRAGGPSEEPREGARLAGGPGGGGASPRRCRGWALAAGDASARTD